jgi:hypothetical protein
MTYRIHECVKRQCHITEKSLPILQSNIRFLANQSSSCNAIERLEPYISFESQYYVALQIYSLAGVIGHATRHM